MRATREYLAGVALAVLAVIPAQDASAWVHRGWGGVSAGRVGEGWAHAGWGGVSAGRVGEGWAHEGRYGATYGYHGDVTTVHNTYAAGAYPASGCWNCGAAAAAVGGLAIGAMAGAAAASASQPSTTVVVQQGPTVGTIVSSLPDGCQLMTVNSKTYYQCGATWYKPTFGADGVDYKVVNVP